jgi:fructose-specific PTS system IIA-like component
MLQVSGDDESAAFNALQRFIHDILPHCDVPLAESSASTRASAIPRSLVAAGVACIPGVPLSRGLGQGKVVVPRKIGLPGTTPSQGPGDSLHELGRIRDAVSAVRHRIGEKLKYSVTPVGAAVLQADLAMVGDVLLVEKLTEQVSHGKPAEQAIVETGKFFMDLLGNSENEYIRQRAADIEEICMQLLEEVGDIGIAEASVQLSEPSVVVAENLGPQQLLQLDRQWLKAVVLEHTGETSHVAILVRSLGIAALTGVRNARLALDSASEIVVDANRGFVVPQISPAVRRFYRREQETLGKRKSGRSRGAGATAITKDGRQVEVAANASSGEELSVAFENGADSIGLFRTEMIFLSRDQAPSEEEQVAVYSAAARAAGKRPVTIRTFDIGGDKRAPYLNLPREENPFLGYRGVRIYAEHSDLLQSQLRAILRASTGSLQIMVPMISSLEEILQFKAAVAQAKQQLAEKKISFTADIKIGIMIEVPSVVFILDQLCKEVDFFSIGTNDLCQYFFAADRGNPRISSLFSVRHPAFLRFLEQAVKQIHRDGGWVGMCGEMAADLLNLPLLVGLELDEISVHPAETLEFKRDIAKLNSLDCAAIVHRAIACDRAAEVDDLLAAEQFHQPEPLLSEDLVLLESTSQSKEEVIQEMVDAFYISGRTDDRYQLEEALWAREAVYSTGLGYGFAAPHCKTDAITADSICVLRLNNPINWGSVDGEQVRMVVLLALRFSEAANTHMQVFSTLARKLMNEDFRQHLLKEETVERLTAYLAKQLGILSEDAAGKLAGGRTFHPA